MKKICFVFGLLLCYHLMLGQIKGSIVNHIVDNTSPQKSYALLVKIYDGSKRLVWSKDLLDYYRYKGRNKASASMVVKRKLLEGNIFNIRPGGKIPIGSIDSAKLGQLSNDAGKGLDFFVNKYFEKNNLRPIYSDVAKEITALLWEQQTYLFTGLGNGSLPSIGVKCNRVLSMPKAGNAIVSESGDNDVKFYFPKYDYYLNRRKPDTSLLYLKLNNKKTDVQRLFPELYSGEYAYARFSVDEAKKTIMVKLYNDSQKFVLKEIYRYGNGHQLQEETNFYSLTSTTKSIKRKVIVPVLLSN